MIDLNQLKRKPESTDNIGARVPSILKANWDRFLSTENLSGSSVLTALITKFLKDHGYLKD